MTQIKGIFSGEVAMQTAMSIPDDLTHALVMASVSGTHESDDPNWQGAEMTYWGYGDLLGGAGMQTGYFLNKHANGGQTFGSFEGQMSSGDIISGTWQLTSGTGRYKAITGGGKFEARNTDPLTVEMTWTGEYNLHNE